MPDQQPPRVSSLLTDPSSVVWSNGVTFDGCLWIAMTLPSTYTQPFLFNSQRPLKIPRSVKVQIVGGEVDSSARLYWNDDLDPPGSSYLFKVYDLQNNLIASGAAPFTVTSSSTTLTIPTLTTPSFSDNPSPQS